MGKKKTLKDKVTEVLMPKSEPKKASNKAAAKKSSDFDAWYESIGSVKIGQGHSLSTVLQIANNAGSNSSALDTGKLIQKGRDEGLTDKELMEIAYS